ncbi:hypothetical protein N7450_005776 [Penicillium hetheringtonii]|uniref:DUF8032 domain-containing protein n=1 Tax=Penicillium hetheringtonii TaxID=911720 RepID=A0AAD6DJ39_9EURO|nr:hypothetical protein N7450_005776 [Penicillium hetheringtonii]
MVQSDLASDSLSKYKEEPADDSLRLGSSNRPSLQHSQQQHPQSIQPHPRGLPSPSQSTVSFPPSTYPQSHSIENSVLHHPSAYGILPQESSYYSTNPSSYTSQQTASAQYPPSGPSDLMATTAQMQRPYPPIYHTPKSNSPASVASQPHDQHARNLYTQSPQIPPQLAPQMYAYQPYSPINNVQQSPYATHPSPQPHPLTTQSMMMPPQTTTAQMPAHQPSHAPNPALASSPAMKMDSSSQPGAGQRPMLNPPLSSPNPTLQGSSAQSPLGASSSAAPGPIPATTPLVVRQDSNGVQWIAFEYSRDRVKMEYTIRCDVESVHVDGLSPEFKTENCVYPRACCNKDNYKGNRLVYESECNTVGWALADLNPALRGKRGLIQRAVDSWRNSNQDPRLRSRRVRRQAKLGRRQSMPATPAPSHMPPTGPGPIPHGLSNAVPPMQHPLPQPPPGSRPSIQGPMSMGPPQLHHHHAQPDGSPKMEEVSGSTEYATRSLETTRLPPAPLDTGDIRLAQVFHDSNVLPIPASAGPPGPSIPPMIRESGLGSIGRHATIATSSRMDAGPGPTSATTVAVAPAEPDDEVSPSNEDLFGQLPGGKRRTFILVEDPQRGSRVRVKVGLDKVNMDDLPDSYRKLNAVYPRTYFPVQMKDAPGQTVPSQRYFRDDTEIAEDDALVVGRTTVPAPSLDGERGIEVPKISRRRHRKEVMLNDLAYRLSWSQSRVFAGRMLFLQQSLDAYRNKMRSSMLAAGQDPADIPEHFDTRRGKRRFLERTSRTGSAAQRSAEEVEG